MTYGLARQEDFDAEERIAALLADRWKCGVHRFPRFSPVDYYFHHGERIFAVGELKCRGVTRYARPTVYFAARKWAALELLAGGFACPALFIVQFLDALCYCSLDKIGRVPAEIRGRSDRPGVANDREPMFLLPVEWMVEVPDTVDGLR